MLVVICDCCLCVLQFDLVLLLPAKRLVGQIVSKMTYNVLSGMLNHTVTYLLYISDTDVYISIVTFMHSDVVV